MRRRHHSLALQVAFLATAFCIVSTHLACAAAAKGAPPKATKATANRGDVSFAKEAVGSIPNGWQIAETNGKGTAAKWEIAEDPSAPNGPKVVAVTANENSGGTFNLLIAKQPALKDVFVSVTVKAVAGKEDQGGGPIWRVKDANNYYVARWNPLETNLRLYYVMDGKRVQLASVEKIKAEPNAWHRISVSHAGNNIIAWFDGKKIVETKDSTLTDTGTVGLWVKADGRSEFAKFRARVPAAATAAKGSPRKPAASPLKDNPMTLAELPPAVKATLDAAGKGGKVGEIVKVTRGEKVVRYEVDVAVDGTSHEIQIGPGGELLRGLPGAATGQPKASGGKRKTGETAKKAKE